MAVPPRPQRLILPLAPAVAGVIGVLTAAMFALVPTELLESMVVDSGIASVLSAAEPPLGFTARAALVLLCGGGVGLVAWFALFLTFGSRTILLQRGRGSAEDAPVLRRADAHPDAPARRPLFANTDLGTPFLEVRARPVHVDAAEIAPVVAIAPLAPPPTERTLPVDLDQPLSAFDPGAVPDAPIDWFPPPATLAPAPAPVPVPVPTEAEAPPPPPPPPRRQTYDPGERFKTFPLTPMASATLEPDAEPLPLRQPAPSEAPRESDPSDTIHALLDRLERVAGRRAPKTPLPPETIENSLTSLRRMATGEA